MTQMTIFGGGDGASPFDRIRRIDPDTGAEHWSARELMGALGYKQWRFFEKAVAAAAEACRGNGHRPEDHIAGARKMVPIGSGATREVEDYRLSRYACYLVSLNGDPRKPEIAAAQNYFVTMTRKAELAPPVRDRVWHEHRLEGKKARRQFTDVLKGHDVEGRGYADCTEAINAPVLGKPTASFRRERGLVKQSQRTRDHCDTSTLAKLFLAEDLAGSRIERDDVRGNDDCVAASGKAARDVLALYLQ